MIGNLLLYLMVIDLREVSDGDLQEFLELLAGQPDPEPAEAWHELRERVLEQLEADAPDREQIAAWPEQFAERLLPPMMAGYALALDPFENLVDEIFEKSQQEPEPERLERFHHCLRLLSQTGQWEARSEAARGIGTLEEELFQLRADYLAKPIQLAECSPASVVVHRQLLGAFDIWQKAFTLAHQSKLEEALDAAYEACCIFRAVETWARLAETPRPEAIAAT